MALKIEVMYIVNLKLGCIKRLKSYSDYLKLYCQLMLHEFCNLAK